MGYYPTGEYEIEEEVRMLQLQLECWYKCKKCGKHHSKTRYPICKSQSKKQRHNGYNWC